jgi:uncharacterized tellurite resistance protein B-like protein
MRTYPINSSHAAGRILALTLISDGNLAPEELETLGRSRILQYVSLDELQFRQVLEDLCNDLLATSRHGIAQLEPSLIDSLLEEIEDGELRRKLLQVMWKIADADDWLSQGEAVLLSRATIAWHAETNFR